MTATRTICKLFFACLVCFFPEAETNCIVLTSSCSFFAFVLLWRSALLWICCSTGVVASSFPRWWPLVFEYRTCLGVQKNLLIWFSMKWRPTKLCYFTVVPISVINLALFMLSSYHHRLKTESPRTQEIAVCFSVKTLFYFLPRALSISLYTQEKLRDRSPSLHSFKVKCEYVQQRKWKSKFSNVLIDCRDRELKWLEQVSRTSAQKVEAKAHVIQPEDNWKTKMTGSDR